MKSLLNEIFNELKNTYKKFLSSTMENTDASRDTATNRLRFVLMHDRTNLAPETMEKMRDELLEVISKYVVVDEEALDLNLASEGDAIALLASIPIVRAKTKEEQEEAILEIEKKKIAKLQEIEEVEILEENEAETEDEDEEDDIDDDEEDDDEDDEDFEENDDIDNDEIDPKITK